MRVLVIDDDADVLRLLGIKLGKEGHQIVTAVDGTAAVARLDEHEPELVILETAIPGTPGLEVVSAAKAQTPTPLVIILSHQDDDASIAAGLAAGADDYVTKPFSPRALSERIRITAIRTA